MGGKQYKRGKERKSVDRKKVQCYVCDNSTITHLNVGTMSTIKARRERKTRKPLGS